MKRVLLAFFALLLFISHPVMGADWSSVVEKVRPSLGYVELWDANDGYMGSCTAFSINDAKDYFLTADHCSSDKLTVDGKEAFPIYQDEASDLMVLVVPDSGSYPEMKLATEVSTGEAVAAYGWGFGLSLPVMKTGAIAVPSVDFPAVFSQMGYGSKDETFCITDFMPIHGMSGGPVFDESGAVVSIVQVQLPDGVGAGRSVGELQAKVGKYFPPA